MTASSIGTYLDIMSTASPREGTSGVESVKTQEDVGVAAQVLAQVLAGKTTVEGIAKATGLDPTAVLAALVALSNAGVVDLAVDGAEVRAAPSESIASISTE